jgi:hypothetical protein
MFTGKFALRNVEAEQGEIIGPELDLFGVE